MIILNSCRNFLAYHQTHHWHMQRVKLRFTYDVPHWIRVPTQHKWIASLHFVLVFILVVDICIFLLPRDSSCQNLILGFGCHNLGGLLKDEYTASLAPPTYITIPILSKTRCRTAKNHWANTGSTPECLGPIYKTKIFHN